MTDSTQLTQTVPSGEPVAPIHISRCAMVFAACFALVVLGLWLFPGLWYTRASSDRPAVWIAERTNVPGWSFTGQAVEKSAEAILAADAIFYGQFARGSGEEVRLFCAKRFAERPGEIGLFVHTPDRCWTEAGWKIEPVDPDFVELEVRGTRLGIERRLFVSPGGGRELVYFFGLVGGQTLPYRLDHNLGVGQRFARTEGTGTQQRAVDRVLWRRVWESFVNRRQLLGPKEFFRISTSVAGPSVKESDALLQRALGELLEAKEFVRRGE